MSTVAEAAPTLLAMLAQRPMTANELRAAYPAKNPLFLASFLRTACQRGDVTFDRVTFRFAAVVRGDVAYSRTCAAHRILEVERVSK